MVLGWILTVMFLLVLLLEVIFPVESNDSEVHAMLVKLSEEFVGVVNSAWICFELHLVLVQDLALLIGHTKLTSESKVHIFRCV